LGLFGLGGFKANSLGQFFGGQGIGLGTFPLRKIFQEGWGLLTGLGGFPFIPSEIKRLGIKAKVI